MTGDRSGSGSEGSAWNRRVVQLRESAAKSADEATAMQAEGRRATAMVERIFLLLEPKKGSSSDRKHRARGSGDESHSIFEGLESDAEAAVQSVVLQLVVCGAHCSNETGDSLLMTEQPLQAHRLHAQLAGAVCAALMSCAAAGESEAEGQQRRAAGAAAKRRKVGW